jgi:flagellar L-ring protein precursor FlgH
MSTRPYSALALLLVLAACKVGNPLDERVAAIPPAVAVAPPPAPVSGPGATGSIFAASGGHALTLAEDRRARRVGDILTVLLVERIDAQKSTRQDSSRQADRQLTLPDVPLFNWIPNELFSGSTDTGFQGQGRAQQSTRISGEITVTVAHVLPNGALMIRGDRRLQLTRGEEQVQLTGLVRPEDIGPDNRVPSTRVADVRLRYTGTGEIAAQSRQGFLSRFFDKVTPF